GGSGRLCVGCGGVAPKMLRLVRPREPPRSERSRKSLEGPVTQQKRALFLGLALLLFVHAARSEADSPSAAAFETNRELPLPFVENQGQTDARVRYFAQGPRYAFYPTREEIVLSRTNAVASTATESAAHRITLALQFLGANPTVALKAEKPVAGEVNYFRGSDPARWQTKLARYANGGDRDLLTSGAMALGGRDREMNYRNRCQTGAWSGGL